jgi:hypothetical protein
MIIRQAPSLSPFVMTPIVALLAGEHQITEPERSPICFAFEMVQSREIVGQPSLRVLLDGVL